MLGVYAIFHLPAMSPAPAAAPSIDYGTLRSSTVSGIGADRSGT